MVLFYTANILDSTIHEKIMLFAASSLRLSSPRIMLPTVIRLRLHHGQPSSMVLMAAAQQATTQVCVFR